jgi:chromosome segregation ATPase
MRERTMATVTVKSGTAEQMLAEVREIELQEFIAECKENAATERTRAVLGKKICEYLAEIEDLRLQKAGLESLLVDAQEEIKAAEMTIADLQVAREELREALRPFAEAHRYWAPKTLGSCLPMPMTDLARAAKLVPENT